MDIASVYLNLESLLGTEIEVEGYYDIAYAPTTVFLYGIEHEPTSERILLPDYVLTESLIKPAYRQQTRARVSIKGILTQNARGDPGLKNLTSIAYQTSVVRSQVMITHRGTQATCQQQTDLVFNWDAYFQAAHKPITDLTRAASIVSRPVLLEGNITPYIDSRSHPDVSFMLAVENVVYSLADLWASRKAPAPSDVIQAIFGRRLPGDKTHAERPAPEFADLMGYTKIWIPRESLANEYLGLYFAERKQGIFRPKDRDTKFRFAGTVASLDVAERKARGFSRRTRLGFTRIDYIAVQQSITFHYSQNEFL